MKTNTISSCIKRGKNKRTTSLVTKWISGKKDRGTKRPKKGYPPPGFVLITEMVNDAIVDLRYFTADNFTGAPVRGYYAPHPILSIEAAKALKKAADVLRESGYLIVVYDTYRPIKAVQCFIEWVNDLDDPGNNRFFPGLTKKQILEHGYIDQYSTHSRGSAIDLGLCNRQGKRIDMGTEFDFFGERSHLDAAVTPEQARNRMILQNAMLNAGFLPQANEWWYFRLEQEPYPDIYWDFDIR